ncbi:UNVERIFIED_CONTAM: hypothetical protein Sangu_0172000 [Sesamum angustifolium]|uniref:Uncharacterized protein n=1 Tax=Sesamum angustifolium TaxID=2727405 RepID=A0AAW2RLJ8_9LAMI
MKKLIRDLSLSVEKIDTCTNGSMFYWKDDIDLDYCKFCGEAKYKPTGNEILTARRYLMSFLAKPCNIRLGLCMNRFALYGQYRRTYSCWHVILTQYSLPPIMCMSSKYMFLKMVIHGPSSPKRLVDVHLADRGVVEFVAYGCIDAQ